MHSGLNVVALCLTIVFKNGTCEMLSLNEALAFTQAIKSREIPLSTSIVCTYRPYHENNKPFNHWYVVILLLVVLSFPIVFSPHEIKNKHPNKAILSHCYQSYKDS